MTPPHPQHPLDAARADTGGLDANVPTPRHHESTPIHVAHESEERGGVRIPGAVLAFIGLVASLVCTIAAGASKAGALEEKVQAQQIAQIDAGRHVSENEARIRELEKSEAATAEHLKNVDDTLKRMDQKLDDALAGHHH